MEGRQAESQLNEKDSNTIAHTQDALGLEQDFAHVVSESSAGSVPVGEQPASTFSKTALPVLANVIQRATAEERIGTVPWPAPTSPRQVSPFSPTEDELFEDYGTDDSEVPGSPSKLLPRPKQYNELGSSGDSTENSTGSMSIESEAGYSSSDPDPMPQIPRRVTVQLRNVFEHFRRRFKQNPLTLRFHDPAIEDHFERCMNNDTAFVNSLLLALGSVQMILVIMWEVFFWGANTKKFQAVLPYQLAALAYSICTSLAVYGIPMLRERQRLVWSILYGLLVFELFVVMDTVEHLDWKPTANDPAEVFVSGNLIVVLFVYTSTLQVPTLNAAIAVFICLVSHVGRKVTFEMEFSSLEADFCRALRWLPTRYLFLNL